jgi:hypothetical protein
MQKSIIKKGLVAGIIVLFIGIGVQPAFAVDISNNRPSEYIEDCGCEINDNNLVRIKSLLKRIESLLDRVEIRIKLITTLYKDHPEVIEDCEEISEKITTFREMNEENFSERISISGSQSNKIICDILEILYLLTFPIVIILTPIRDKYEEGTIIYIMLTLVAVPLLILASISAMLLYVFDCPPPPFP